MTKNLEPIPAYGDHMSAIEFSELVSCGMFTSYDGSGYWATESKMDSSTNVFNNAEPKPEWATHVVWFNK